MVDSNVVNCPFDPSEERLSLEDFGQTLFEGLRRHPTSIALCDVSSGEYITYEELERKSEIVARHLLRIKCTSGDVIGIFSPNSIEWMIVFASVMRIGAVVAGIDCLTRAGELKYLLSRCKPKVLYTTAETAAVVLQLEEEIPDKIIVKGGLENCISFESLLEMTVQLPELPTFEQLNRRPNDLAMIMFSSGTTGIPKAVQFTHRNQQAIFAITRHPESGLINPQQIVFAPLSHAAGYIFVVSGLALGYKSFLMPRFDLRVFLRCIQDNKLEKIFVVPPVASLLAKSHEVLDYRLGHLKGLVCGAAPLSSNIEALLVERFPALICRQVYGMTETCGPCCAVPALDRKKGHKPGSVGVPLINVRMKVVDIDVGTSLGPNQLGEIWIKGPMNTPGYKDSPEETAALIDKDGWIHTGDIGYHDEDGYFFIVDRLKELIKYNAYQVSPAELEGVLMSHPQVLDAGVFPIPDSQAGQLPSAFVVPRSGSKVTELELQQFVSERVSPYKRLRGGISFVAAVPKSASGKILRRRMREENTMRGKL